MTFESFVVLYEKDIKPKLKLNTWRTKESIIQKKILPYFAKRKLSEITSKDIMRWQNEIREMRDCHGKPLSKTYLSLMGVLENRPLTFVNIVAFLLSMAARPWPGWGETGGWRQGLLMSKTTETAFAPLRKITLNSSIGRKRVRERFYPVSLTWTPPAWSYVWRTGHCSLLTALL